MKTRSTLVFSTLVAALGGLLFGFDTAVISGTTEALQGVFALDEFWLGFAVASALIGTIVGAFAVGRPTERWGRKRILIGLAVLYFVSAVGSALASTLGAFVAFRFIGGLGVGAASVVSPLYIAEISPARMRGRLVAINQLNVVLGILLAFLSNYVLAAIFAEGVACLALDAGGGGLPGRGVLRPALPDPGEPALAGEAGAGRGGAGGPAPGGRG
jgi:MFS family permease